MISSIEYFVEITSDNEVVPTITLTGNGEIHYTLDGTTPTSQSPVYTEPFYLLETTTIKSAIIKDGEVVSDVATKDIIVALPKATYWNGTPITSNADNTPVNVTNNVTVNNVSEGDIIVMKFTVTEYPVVGATSHIIRLRDSNFKDIVAKDFWGNNTLVIGKEYIKIVKASSSYILKFAGLVLTGSPSSGNFTANITGYIYSGS